MANKSYFSFTIYLLVVLFVFMPLMASAHQPRLVTEQNNVGTVVVPDPEISKAYYHQLAGETQKYLISSDKPFDLYVNILLPKIASQKKDVSVTIFKNDQTKKQIAYLDANKTDWKEFWESYGRDWYWQGLEYKSQMEAGEYKIVVSSTNNDSKYALAIGETEFFDAKEGYNASRLVPVLKNRFFDSSPINFIFSPFGVGYVLMLYVLAFVFGFIYRLFMKTISKRNSARKLSHNIGKRDRLMRASLGVFLLFLALLTSWNPLTIFFSGFCIFEAIFSWCGLYVLIGRNSCPI